MARSLLLLEWMMQKRIGFHHQRECHIIQQQQQQAQLLLLANSNNNDKIRCRHLHIGAATNNNNSNGKWIRMHPEVRSALTEGRPVVALESALITHGLPYPENHNVAVRLEQVVRREGALPATIALLDGHIHVGLRPDQLERIAATSNPSKVSVRDLANCLIQKKIGGTTVASTMRIAHWASIKVFGTGGIGGVHRGAEQSMDVSADLIELGRTPVAVVCAGVKSILDIGKTLEWLETQCVNVIVFDREPYFPGFFSPRTTFRAPHCTESLQEVANILVCSDQLGLRNGLLLACPLPADQSQLGGLIENAIQRTLEEAKQKGISGKDVTPFVLRQVSQISGAESQRLNVCLLENNVKMASQLAIEYVAKKDSDGDNNRGGNGIKEEQQQQQQNDSGGRTTNV